MSFFPNDFRLRQLEEILSNLEARTCNGNYVWRITDFQQRRQDARNEVKTALFSPAIYSHMHGYKFCVRLHINGVDDGAGSHVSLFVHVLQGEFDHRLSWPFSGAITLSILDQSHDRNDVSKTVVTSPNLLAFQQPTATCHYIGCGFQQFAPIGEVCAPRYIKNDTMLVRIDITRALLAN